MATFFDGDVLSKFLRSPELGSSLLCGAPDHPSEAFDILHSDLIIKVCLNKEYIEQDPTWLNVKHCIAVRGHNFGCYGCISEKGKI